MLAATPVLANERELIELRVQLEALQRRLDASTPIDIRADIDAFAARLAALESATRTPVTTSAAARSVSPAAPSRAFAIKAEQDGFQLSFRGGAHVDTNTFLGDEDLPLSDTTQLRRVRPTIEGKLGSWAAFRFTPELAGDSARILDAWVDLNFSPALQLRAGKQKSPVGLERLQSFTALHAIERGFATELSPNRELGLQLGGKVGSGLSYAIGVFNGGADGRDAGSTDPDGKPELQGRVFFEPSPGLGFGLGFSQGDKEGSGNNFLPRYRSAGQQVFFNYRSAVAADGRHRRLAPQGYLYRGPFGLLAEFTRSEQTLALAGQRERISNSGWQLLGSWFLTGENASYRGLEAPAEAYVPGKGGRGAFELVGRIGRLDVDDDAFVRLADATTAATAAEGATLGLNWYLNSNLKLSLNYALTRFDGGAAAGADRETERALFSRIQVSY